MPISRIVQCLTFPISRDPPEGGTNFVISPCGQSKMFPISRDPPEGGTPGLDAEGRSPSAGSFQFLGIPPKGERRVRFKQVK